MPFTLRVVSTQVVLLARGFHTCHISLERWFPHKLFYSHVVSTHVKFPLSGTYVLLVLVAAICVCRYVLHHLTSTHVELSSNGTYVPLLLVAVLCLSASLSDASKFVCCLYLSLPFQVTHHILVALVTPSMRHCSCNLSPRRTITHTCRCPSTSRNILSLCTCHIRVHRSTPFHAIHLTSNHVELPSNGTYVPLLLVAVLCLSALLSVASKLVCCSYL
jgi:hypothetical protein